MKNLIINYTATIIDAFKQMDEVGQKLLMLYKGDDFEQLISVGDLQRALLSGASTDTLLTDLKIAPKQMASIIDSDHEIQQRLRKMKAPYTPVVNEDGSIDRIVYNLDFRLVSNPDKLKGVPVVVMAGGKGTRLKPITNVIPKPLVPIGEKAIAHEIMDRLADFGARDFLYSVNYKWEMIRDYFKDVEHPYNLEFFLEEKPMGTAGSLSLMRDKLKSTFFISNCDIIVEDDYANMMEYHEENKNAITVIASLKTYEIPYGIMTRTEDGFLDEFHEKPSNTYMVSTGLYILESEVLDYLPDGEHFHITELIESVKKDNKRVGIFPVSEASWKDIGEWPSYLKNYVQL